MARGKSTLIKILGRGSTDSTRVLVTFRRRRRDKFRCGTLPIPPLPQSTESNWRNGCAVITPERLFGRRREHCAPIFELWPPVGKPQDVAAPNPHTTNGGSNCSVTLDMQDFADYAVTVAEPGYRKPLEATKGPRHLSARNIIARQTATGFRLMGPDETRVQSPVWRLPRLRIAHGLLKTIVGDDHLAAGRPSNGGCWSEHLWPGVVGRLIS